jgi:hypothetical protein
MEPLLLLFYVALFVLALLYASVGHGGASGYLALMALFAFAPAVMKPTALLLNLFVASVAFVQFYRGGFFQWRTFLPFALASIPFSFLGGLISLDPEVYKKILGLLLLIPVGRFLFLKEETATTLRSAPVVLSLIIGGIIGLLSGMIGIGGGIILSPILLLFRWTNQKETAAISALFILVNSVSGLAGQLTKGLAFSTDMFSYVLVAFAGGLCGAYLGSFRFPQATLKYVLSLVLTVAAVKLLLT